MGYIVDRSRRTVGFSVGVKMLAGLMSPRDEKSELMNRPSQEKVEKKKNVDVFLNFYKRKLL